MKTSELTDRRLLDWIDEQIDKRIQRIQHCESRNAEAFCNTEKSAVLAEARGLECDALSRLRNNLRLGIRCIDGELPELADRPWDERDELDNGPTAVADKILYLSRLADVAPELIAACQNMLAVWVEVVKPTCLFSEAAQAENSVRMALKKAMDH